MGLAWHLDADLRSGTRPRRNSRSRRVPDLEQDDFVRSGTRGATYLAYRKALQEAVSRQLAAWGDSQADSSATPRTVKLDRDLARVLEDLADEFPLLHSLVERRKGGQKRLPMGDRAAVGLRPVYSVGGAPEPEMHQRVPEDDAGERSAGDPPPPTDTDGSSSPSRVDGRPGARSTGCRLEGHFFVTRFLAEWGSAHRR